MKTSCMITSKHIYMEHGCKSGTILIKDGKIQQYYKLDEALPMNIEHIHAEDHYVIPGIMDVHSHGYLSWSAKTIDKEEIKGLSKVLPSIGVTSTLATTTAWKKHEYAMLSSIADAIEEGCDGARILGIHMEGPFYNPDRHNATPRKEVMPPSVEKAKAYWNVARGHLKYMTIAPEMKGAIDVIHWLTEKGVIMGAGHTSAVLNDMKQAIKAGIKASIHTGNAMLQMDRREIGAMGASLLDPDLYCEVICDLFHLSKEMLEIMFRIKGDPTKFLMISDSDQLSGIEPGDYIAFGKTVHVHSDGRILLDDGTISGSSKYVLYGIQNLVDTLHIPLEEVIPMFSLNPATLLGIQEKKGSIKIGKDADIVILNQNFEVEATFVEGCCRYQRGDSIEKNKQFSQICRRIR